MITVNVLLDSVQKVKEFSAAMTKLGVESELVDGPRILDASSIMGIFSLDLTHPVQLNLHTEDRTVLERLKKFIV